MAIDLDLAWKAIIERQFGGDSGRGFCELIQNLLDSYASDVPLGERRGSITCDKTKITIEDWGEGLDRERISHLVTLGGTDKRDDSSKIGQFGIGFFSIFNPSLGTQTVTVTTRCEGHAVEVRFSVSQPSERPSIRHRFLERDLPFSTRIEVEFDDVASVQRCVQWARMALQYYPCTVSIDGTPEPTVWKKAADAGSEIFTDGACQGFIEPAFSASVLILCKFERLSQFSAGNFSTGGHGMKYDLRDLERRHIPCVPQKRVTINCNDLHVTIGREGFRMNHAFERMVKTVARELGAVLLERLKSPSSCQAWDQLVIANQFILAKELGGYLAGESDTFTFVQSLDLLELLADAQVYPLANREGLFSLADLRRMRSKDLPLFYSPEGRNPRWLGGNFLNDFVVCPPACNMGGGAPDLYQDLFGRVFTDAVNLDGIEGDQATIAKLADRGIVDREFLAPKTGLVEDPDLEPAFVELLDEINALLNDQVFRDAVREGLKISARSITASYFAVEKDNVTIPTALLERSGKAYNPTVAPQEPQDLLLGLQLQHPLVRGLARSSDPYRAYYAVTYLTRELVKCQRILIPYSRPFNRLKRDLNRKIRKGLIERFVKAEMPKSGDDAQREQDGQTPRADGATGHESARVAC